MQKLKLYAFFHLNLAYSSIEEEQRLEVINQCYQPLLDLAEKYNLPFGIEASAYTLTQIQLLKPTWIKKLSNLIQEKKCELIGSGYCQIIGPLIPAKVNLKNLEIGNKIYHELLGIIPKIALINEQAYSSGIIEHYLKIGYEAIIMEWNNPARHHPEWNQEWRYFPQFACNQHGQQIPVIWNKSIAFQKFQRYAHGEMELEEYIEYLNSHLSLNCRAFPLYGNDVEVFNFRPGRYHTEATLNYNEWDRIETLFQNLSSDHHFEFIAPSQVLSLMSEKNADNELRLESCEQPIPVKKQGKYNITRWAVTGRDDSSINTHCWRIYEHLNLSSKTTDLEWQELCYLWSSDFRTHITEKRWLNYQQRLSSFSEKLGIKPQLPLIQSSSKPQQISFFPDNIKINRFGRFLEIETNNLKLILNCRRGLAIDKLWFKQISPDWLCGTLHHGYYNDIYWGADYYTGHLVYEIPGSPKITDLNQVEPVLEWQKNTKTLVISSKIQTVLGLIYKQILINEERSQIELIYQLNWKKFPLGSLRLGNITLNPEVFNKKELFYETHNGGNLPEKFMIREKEINHGEAISFLHSASTGLGITEGILNIGDKKKGLSIRINPTCGGLIGLIRFKNIDDSYFYRCMFSAKELDDTSRTNTSDELNITSYNIIITNNGNTNLSTQAK